MPTHEELDDPPQHVAVVGGGLAGLAAAAVLCEHGWEVELLEARRQFGGRAGSFYDSTSQEMTDHCQHVSLGCCVNFQDFCRRTGLAKFLKRDGVLTFVGTDGQSSTVQAARWLPAPLHLLPSLLQLNYLPIADRLAIARTLWRLARTRTAAVPAETSMEQWLAKQGATHRARENFWSVILVSALAIRLDRISYADGRKVFVDGFMANTSGYELQIPAVPLATMYQLHLMDWLTTRGVNCRLGATLKRVVHDSSSVQAIELEDGNQHTYDQYVLAIPWRRIHDVIPAGDQDLAEQLAGIRRIESSPITAVHLWLDRPITDLSHAVIVGRLSQWIFHRSESPNNGSQISQGHYYQVVISASRDLEGRRRDEVIKQVHSDLCSVFPSARNTRLLHSRMVTQKDAVFVVPGDVAGYRPTQQTSLQNLVLAGDWTATGWPATMEGAVRSGYLAAECLLRAQGVDTDIVVQDLPLGWLARCLLKH